MEDKTKPDDINTESWRLDNPRAWYFDNSSKVLKTMRFFNLLELGKPVISWTKLMLMLSFVLVLFATVFYIIGADPNGLEKVLAAVGIFLGTLLNYGYKRTIIYMRFIRGEKLND